ncbi:uncharacterized protein LOC129764370 [Toxorhynchites rutilus septentrionalis]|uniref:uncharacterized protein LOC129764370 n=1 Tax=Toxorhynchites rutilus septentrionalis TaxID=329112 RepID=UPI002478761B|nr:uncharacterized protein LOC129764370 [Toxorhynchites rutilus septentrionalis]
MSQPPMESELYSDDSVCVCLSKPKESTSGNKVKPVAVTFSGSLQPLPQTDGAKFEEEARKIWDSMSEKFCACRRAKFLEEIRNNRSEAQRDNAIMKLKIIAYRSENAEMLERIKEKYNNNN